MNFSEFIVYAFVGCMIVIILSSVVSSFVSSLFYSESNDKKKSDKSYNISNNDLNLPIGVVTAKESVPNGPKDYIVTLYNKDKHKLAVCYFTEHDLISAINKASNKSIKCSFVTPKNMEIVNSGYDFTNIKK